MEVEALFVQINELEETNRRQGIRYYEEVSSHQHTKKELEKGNINGIDHLESATISC